MYEACKGKPCCGKLPFFKIVNRKLSFMCHQSCPRRRYRCYVLPADLKVKPLARKLLIFLRMGEYLVVRFVTAPSVVCQALLNSAVIQIIWGLFFKNTFKQFTHPQSLRQYFYFLIDLAPSRTKLRSLDCPRYV